MRLRAVLLGFVLLSGCSPQRLKWLNESQSADPTSGEYGVMCSIQGDDHISVRQVGRVLWANGIHARYNGSFVYQIEVDRALVAKSQDLLEGSSAWGELATRIRLIGRPHPEVTKIFDMETRLRKTAPVIENRAALDAVRDLGPDLALTRHVLTGAYLDAVLLRNGLLTLTVIPRGASTGPGGIEGCEVLVLLKSVNAKDSNEWIGQVYREDGEVRVVGSSGSRSHSDK